MSRARICPLLAAAAVAAVLYHGWSGHGLPQPSAQDGLAGAAVGLCLLLTTVLAFVGMPKPGARRPVAATPVATSYVEPPRRPALDGRARASPTALQRFRN